MKADYRCWAEIDRSALRHNVKVVRERVGSTEILAVVKANAYGHGLIAVAKTLADQAQLFGVANLDEALTLREILPHPVIILGPALPAERAVIAERGFIPTISASEEAEHFNRVARQSPVAVNFKIDTGMGRMGVPQGEALDVFKKVCALPNIRIHSVSTHLPAAAEDAGYTRDQLLRFGGIMEGFRAAVPIDYRAHVLQSAGLLGFTEPAGVFDMVRAGIVLYGISPLPEYQSLFKPAMTWKTRVSLVRDVPKGSTISYGRTFTTPRKMRVATLSAGYADGYPWRLSNRNATVLIRGQRCPILGRVTMDLMMSDVSQVENLQLGDEVILMGRDGNEEISCAELATMAGTIPWEITTRIGERVKRIYI
jgi:alanine racemase